MERLTILAPAGRIDNAVAERAIEQMDSRDHGNESPADAEDEQTRRALTATNGHTTRAAQPPVNPVLARHQINQPDQIARERDLPRLERGKVGGAL